MLPNDYSPSGEETKEARIITRGMASMELGPSSHNGGARMAVKVAQAAMVLVEPVLYLVPRMYNRYISFLGNISVIVDNEDHETCSEYQSQ